MALLCVILKPWRASRAAPACTSLSNSTKAMSWRPGTRRTSLKPGNLGGGGTDKRGSSCCPTLRPALLCKWGVMGVGWGKHGQACFPKEGRRKASLCPDPGQALDSDREGEG